MNQIIVTIISIDDKNNNESESARKSSNEHRSNGSYSLDIIKCFSRFPNIFMTIGIEIVKWKVPSLLTMSSPNKLGIFLFNPACMPKTFLTTFFMALIIIVAMTSVIECSDLVAHFVAHHTS